MSDDDNPFVFLGPVIGACRHCLKPIHEGPGGNTMNYSCGCVPRNALMYAPPDAAEGRDG